MKPADAKRFDPMFAEIKSRFEARSGNGLVCKQGFYKDCAVLKLQKAFWTNDSMDRVQNTSGIFFSIWVNDASPSRAHYNIHALKLARLEGYSIRSRDFANQFRSEFAFVRDSWPNVSLDYGPLTLMEGWIEFHRHRFERDALALMARFRKLTPLIDRLLAARRKLRP